MAMFVVSLFSVSVWAQTDVTSTYLTNAGFSSLDGWTKVADASFNDSGVGLIGAYTVRADVGTAATVDATHLATEYCLGLEFRWGAYVSYTQETATELSNGIYTLTFDVENTNANTVADNYASMFFVQVGDTKYEDTAVEWKKGGTTGWTTHTISFVVNSPAKATISLGIGAGGTNRGHAETPVIYVSHLKLEQTGDVQYATEEQKQALKDAIAQAESHVLGFEVGEYAPYNNVDAAKALAAAQAIDVEVEQAEVVAEALAALEVAVWTANEEEMNAIFDASFEYAYSTEGNVQPIAWHGINNHDNATDIRYMWNATKDAGLTATSTDKALFTKYNAFYGTEVGYTMPLKENTKYELTFIYGGWSDCQKDGYVTITGPNDEVVELSADRLPLDAVDGHTNPASWKTYTATFTTGAAGNYVLGLRTGREAEGKQSQYVYGDFKLYTAVPEKTDYTDAIKNADLSTAYAEGVVGADWDLTNSKGIKSGYARISGKVFDFSQTITLPAGKYKMTAKAAYRFGGDEQTEYNAIQAGGDTHLAKLYAETSSYKYETDVMNRYEGASDASDPVDGFVIVNGKLVPNSSDAVKACFDAGQYVNELVFNVQAEGAVKIGIAKEVESSDYTNIGAWTLTRLGDAEADPEVEEPTPDPDPTPDPEKPEIGDVTSKYLVNADFETPSAQQGNAINTPPGWTMTYDLGGWLDGSTRLSENPGNDASQCFNVWAGEFRSADIYQKPVLPAGKYTLYVGLYSDTPAERYAYASVDGQVFKSEVPETHSWKTVSVTFLNPVEGEVTLGAKSFGWFQIDNVRLEYLGDVMKDDYINAYNQALDEAKALVGKKMSLEVAPQLDAVILANGSLTADSSIEELEVATEAISEVVAVVKASVDAYAANKLAIDAMYALMESTNVYTAEAFLAYKAIADDYLAQYEAGTLTATVDNPGKVHGWHAEVAYDDMLLSAFGTNNFDTNLYINTWSTEGENDGSGFTVPFFEYWTEDGNSLGTTTKTATVTGLTPGRSYSAEAWVRTRAKNGVAAADATGITLSVGDGEAVDVTEGEVVGESQFAHAVYTAVGKADAEGNLIINFTVADDNNVSWLSFKNIKYAEYGGETAVESVESQAEAVIYDLSGRRVQKMTKGLYIVNGRKVIK